MQRDCMKTDGNRYEARRLLGAVLAVLASAAPGMGGTFPSYWVASQGAWEDPNNWNPSVLPESFVSVYIDNGGIAEVWDTGNVCKLINIGFQAEDSGTLRIHGGQLEHECITLGRNGAGTVEQFGGTHLVHGDVRVGGYGTGAYAITDGQLDTHGLVVGGENLGPE